MCQKEEENVTLRKVETDEDFLLINKIFHEIKDEYQETDAFDVEKGEVFLKTVANNPAYFLYFAIIGDEPIGICVANASDLFYSSEKLTTLYFLFVRPAYRRTRAAGSLFYTLVQWSKNRGVKKILCSVTISNPSSDQFFKRCGGRFVGGNYFFDI